MVYQLKEEFIFLGSKQSSNGYCRTDVLRRIGLLFSYEFSAEGMELQFSQYQHQSTPVSSTALTQTLLVTDMNTLEAFHMRCRRQIGLLDVCWWAHVSNAEVLQRSSMSTIGDILRHRRLSLAMLHAWTLEYDALRLTVITVPTKAERLEKTTRSPSQRLAQQDSGGCQRNDQRGLRCGDLRSPGGHGAAQRFTRTTRRRRR